MGPFTLTWAWIAPFLQLLLPTPTIRDPVLAISAFRANCTGINLGTSGQVEITNDLGTIIVNAAPYNATSFEVLLRSTRTGKYFILDAC